MNNENRIGNAAVFTTAKNCFQKFYPNLKFKELNKTLLKDFQQKMKKEQKSPTTAAIYLRSLRAVCNRAINNKIMKKDDYPFSGFMLPASKNIKKAMSLDAIKKVIEYIPYTDTESKARDFWLFSYYCNGMNIKDICELKWSDIDEPFILYRRSKTANTRKEDKVIRVALLPEAKSIVERWGNKNNPGGFVFGIINPEMDARLKKVRIKGFNRNMNRSLKSIATTLDIKGPLGNMSARHSFATVLKRKGVATEYISESLGHTSLTTTENYLDSFLDETKIKYSKFLTNL
jgi:integrase